MNEDEKMYEIICSKRFDKIDTQQQTTIDLIKGRNGNPGLLDDVRTLKAAHKKITATVVFVASALLLQAVHATWVWAAKFF
jgi:hypothetical protein